MVDVRHNLPRDTAGAPDLDSWIRDLASYEDDDRARLTACVALLADRESRIFAGEMVDILLDLRMDTSSLVAGLVLYPLLHGLISLEAIDGDDERDLVMSVLRMSSTDTVALTNAPLLVSESRDQIENVRHMLVALIDDPRVAVVKLAERVVTLRRAKNEQVEAKERIAREVLDFYGPLANRLGIWQLKWILEDLAFRYLYEHEYRAIASQLDGRRDDRDKQIAVARLDLLERLSNIGLHVEIQGRAKHIYSIWRKMQEKRIDFTEVYDVQALRVIVDRVADCYSALGVVHTSWQHIPSEFDDYIANPKENGYRSIHTAVVGPQGRTLEVQIRTRAMHDEAELGVCAHWSYKSDDDALNSDKMDWLRRVLEWHDEISAQANGGLEAFEEERVFVTTPKGHVIDLRHGATPIDFAYRVHTEIGHRCRGAQVDGSNVPLNAPLTTGQVVEVLTGDDTTPRREWLNPALGYVKTSRARAKIQNWFRDQVAESNISAGRSLLDDAFQRLDVGVDYASLAVEMGYADVDAFFEAIGVGDLIVVDVVRAVLQKPVVTRQLSLLPSDRVEGEMTDHSIVITAEDRRGLLRDITSVLATMAVDVVSTSARANEADVPATVSLELRTNSLLELARIIDRIRRVPDVLDVRRAHA